MKTYTARNSADALAMARGDLGADAVVLRTREYKRGGLFGFPALGGRPVVEVTAVALSVLQAAAKRREQKARGAGAGAGGAAVAATPAAARSAAGLQAASAPTAGDLIRRTYAAARLDLGEPGAAAAAADALTDPLAERPRPPAPLEASPAAAVGPGPDPAPLNALASELAAVKALVARVAQAQERDALERPRAPGAAPTPPGPGAEAYARLIRAEVSEELAQRLSAGSTGGGDAEAAVTRVLREAGSGEGDDPGQGPPGGAPIDAYRRLDGDARPLTLAFVGPTGVGKTTTVAKLAAQLKLRHGRSVGVVTLDTYRIGAVEQLRTYCSIIGTELQVAASPEELGARLDALAACDVVLIDTAGRSPRDNARVGELEGFLRVARPHQTHLVLSLTSSAGVLRAASTRFAAVGLHRLVLTKADESPAPGCGHALAAIEQAGLSVSFVTTGQEVPHDIEVAEPGGLARRLLGGGDEVAAGVGADGPVDARV